VPSDRLRKSILATLSAGDNTLLPSYGAVATFGLRRGRAERDVFDQAAERLHLRPRRMDLEAKRFSGGNQQKLVIARWLNAARQCRVLLLDEPTQGVDVGARRDIYEALSATAEAGRAVIVTSSEPEELVQIAHRVIVLSHGRIVGVLAGEDIAEHRLLALAHALETGQDAA
jgi:ribose transport system ATP-binding protein